MAFKQVQNTIKVTAEELDKMILNASDPEHDVAALKLSNRLPHVDKAILDAAQDKLEAMIENWQGYVNDSKPNKAEVCIKLAELGILNSESFRSVLDEAFHLLMPKYLDVEELYNALGTNDMRISVEDVAARFRKCQKFETNSYVFRENKAKNDYGWYKILNLGRSNPESNHSGQITIQTPDARKVSRIEPLSSIVKYMTFFQFTTEMNRMITYFSMVSEMTLDKLKNFTRESCLAVLKRNALTPLTEDQMRGIIRLTPGWDRLSDADFDTWWGKEAEKKFVPHDFSDARSLLELHALLPMLNTGKTAEKSASASPVEIEITDENAVKIADLFEKLGTLCLPDASSVDGDAPDVRARIKSIAATQKTLAECIGVLGGAKGSDENKAKIFSVLRGKVDFWPTSEAIHDGFSYAELRKLEIWTDLAAKLLPGFVEATRIFYDDAQDKMLTMAFQLPAKCISAFFAKRVITPKLVDDYVFEHDLLSSDLVLWLFKNKAHLSAETMKSINMDRCISSVSLEKLPNQWLAAQRELRKSLFGDTPVFQRFLLDNAGDDIPSILEAFRRYAGFQPKEKQSVQVKYSRLSKVFRDYLETHADEVVVEEEEEITVTNLTSHLSLNKLKAELEDIITVQVPKNNKDYAIAKSFGDLRENAEFDAAKERKKFLQGRQRELEREISSFVATDFMNVELNGAVVLGCMVTLAAQGEKEVTYAILGAADGAPERNFISYNAPLGQLLRNKHVGDSVTLPSGKVVEIKSIDALPEDIRKELACED